MRFEEARALARSLGLRNETEWLAWCRGRMPEKPERPPGVPTLPHKAYAGRGWAGMGDWLGTGSVANAKKVFRSFAAARTWARRLGLRSVKQWRRLCQGELHGMERPADVPACPDVAYRDRGWKGWGDFLANE